MSRETNPSPASAPTPPRYRPFLRPIGLFLGTSLLAVALVGFGLSVIADSLPAVSSERTAAALGATETASSTAASDRYPAPDFRLPVLDEDRLLGPPDFPGEVVVIDLWATWCGPCRLQAKYLEQIHEEYDGQGVQFLAIDTGEDEATVRRYVEKTPFPYPVLMDPSQSVQTRYRASGLPTVLIVDAAGNVSFVNVGVTDPASLRFEIEKAKRAGQPSA